MLTTGYISILQQSSFIYTLLLLIGGGGNNGHNTNNDNNSTTSSNDSWDDTDLTLKQRRTREDGGLMLEPDDFDDFVTSSNDPDIDTDNIGGNSEEQHEFTNLWDSTNTGEFVLEVEGDEMERKGVLNDITINGHVLLNQCGCLLTRKKHMVKGNKKQKFFLQKLCATSTGSSVPLVYTETHAFPIHILEVIKRLFVHFRSNTIITTFGRICKIIWFCFHSRTCEVSLDKYFNNNQF